MKKALKIYFSFLLIAIVVHSCCDPIKNRIIGSGVIDVYDVETGQELSKDSEEVLTVTGESEIHVLFETIVVESLFDFGLMQGAYANSCPDEYSNYLDLNTLKIHVNREFIFDEEIIEKNSNLIDLESFDLFTSYDRVTVLFDTEFLDSVDFSNEIYDFTFEVTTTDGLELSNTIKLRFEI